MLLPQLALEDLPARVLRQRVGEHHVLGPLVARQLLLGVGVHVVLGEPDAGLRHDDRRDRLDPRGVADAEHRDLGDPVELVDRLLHLPRRDVLAAGLDHVLLAVDHREVAVLGHHAEVAGVEPAARERLGGLLLVLVVAQRGVRGAVHDLADLARGHRLPVVVDQQRLDVDRRPARRAGVAQLLVGPQDRGERGHLGLAVEVPELHVGQPPSELLEHLDRHRRRAVVALAQRREVAGVEVGVPQQRDPHGRRAEQLRHPLPLDRREQGGGLGRGQDDAGGAEVDVHREEAVELRAVVHRQRVRLDVVGGHLAVDHARHVLADQRPRRQQHALGPRLRAARVHEAQRVVVGHRDLGVVGRARAPPVVHVLPAVVVAADPPPQGDRVVDRLLRRGEQRVVGHHRGSPGVPEDVADLVGVQHEVDRHEHHAELRGGEHQHRERPGVAREQREPVALGEPAGGERARGPVHRGVELGERVALLAVHHGELVGRTLGGAPQEIANGVLAGPRDGGGGVGAERHALTVDVPATSRAVRRSDRRVGRAGAR